VIGIVGNPSIPRRPRAGPHVDADLLSEVLDLIALDPTFVVDAEDLSQSLISLGSLLVGPSPDSLRAQGSRAVVAVLDRLVTEPTAARTAVVGM
jgi:hypothetical protein